MSKQQEVFNTVISSITSVILLFKSTRQFITDADLMLAVVEVIARIRLITKYDLAEILLH